MRKSLTKIFWNIEVWAVQKHVHLVDLVKSFPTNIFLQNLASIQKRTNPIKFTHLAEKSEKGSISNLSTKARFAPGAPITSAAAHPAAHILCPPSTLMRLNFLAGYDTWNFGRLVLGCIEAAFLGCCTGSVRARKLANEGFGGSDGVVVAVHDTDYAIAGGALQSCIYVCRCRFVLGLLARARLLSRLLSTADPLIPRCVGTYWQKSFLL